MKIERRYLDGSYLDENPDWDRQDAEWKATKVFEVLRDHGIAPRTLADVGCGSGDILRALARRLPDTAMVGFDVSPQLAPFWAAAANERLRFVRGDFQRENQERFDVLLMIDVFEHVRDPFTFLEEARRHATHFVFHIPLDLSALSVLRGKPLMDVRHSVGHLHFYTRELALQTLEDSGYAVTEWRFTHAALQGPGQSLRTRLARWPRRLAQAFDADVAARLLGGETLLVLARAADG